MEIIPQTSNINIKDVTVDGLPQGEFYSSFKLDFL